MASLSPRAFERRHLALGPGTALFDRSEKAEAGLLGDGKLSLL